MGKRVKTTKVIQSCNRLAGLTDAEAGVCGDEEWRRGVISGVNAILHRYRENHSESNTKGRTKEELRARSNPCQ